MNLQLAKFLSPIEILTEKYLPLRSSVLTIGCENVDYLTNHGHFVTILDSSELIIDTLKNRQFEKIVGLTMQNLPPISSPFKAVVCGSFFSSIPSGFFEKVMKQNILKNIESGVFFVGSFLGQNHTCLRHSELTIVTKEKLAELFSSMCYAVLEFIEEEKVNEEGSILHKIHVIALRVL